MHALPCRRLWKRDWSLDPKLLWTLPRRLVLVCGCLHVLALFRCSRLVLPYGFDVGGEYARLPDRRVLRGRRFGKRVVQPCDGVHRAGVKRAAIMLLEREHARGKRHSWMD